MADEKVAPAASAPVESKNEKGEGMLNVGAEKATETKARPEREAAFKDYLVCLPEARLKQIRDY
jgi:hypothetical protein